MTLTFDFLEKLIRCPSPSGDETAIQRLWLEEMRPYAHKLETDPAGNAIAILNPDAPYKVLLAGHCDEIAFMIKHIDDKGMISVVAAGGISPKLAPGSRVRILGAKPLIGVVAVPPEHSGGAKSDLKVADLTIDVGATQKCELDGLVAVGDYVVYDVDFTYLLGDQFTGRALDNRTGAFIVAEVLKALSKESLAVGVYGVSTTGEETTMGGAYFAASRIAPTMAIACDVTFATCGPDGDPKKDGDVKLGGGPVLAKGSQVNSCINTLLLNTAKSKNIPLQWELTPRATGTDADKMRFTNHGVPVALVSLPLRYMHSPSEVGNLKDIGLTVDLIVEMIKDLKGTEDLHPLKL